MVRYLSWLANGALFVICCFLVANTANTVIASWLTPEPSVKAPGSESEPTARRDYSVILGRNVFNASLLAPAVPLQEEQEDLEATKLPLQLLGTVAGARPDQSWAAVQHTAQRKTLILRAGDPIEDEAEVVRIERRRIVLLEKGEHRELALDEDEKANGSRRITRARPSTPEPRRRARRAATERVRQVAEDHYEIDPEDEVVRNPVSIFQEAQFQPHYEGSEMVGMRLNGIKPGGLLDQAGFQDGEVIVEVNGIPIDGPEATAEIAAEFAEADEVTVLNDQGEARTFEPLAGREE